MPDEQEQEEKREVKDKRRVNPDGTLKEDQEAKAQTTESAEEEQTTQDEQTTSEEDEMPAPNVYDLLQFIVGMIAEQAWVHMGIRITPGQKEPVIDLVQAKIAIDTVSFITDKLHPHVSEEMKKALRGIVSDLQLNYVRHTQ